MKNTFGNALTLTLFGESHGAAVGAVLDGLTPGLPVDDGEIRAMLARRRPRSALDTARKEPDDYRIVSGVLEGRTTGTPLCILIPNTDTKSGDYTPGMARPSHADYTARCKYHGFEDYRGGGHFSGRVTAALVAAGGILLPALRRLGISIGTHILSCGGVEDVPFSKDPGGEIARLFGCDFPVLAPERGEKMTEAILAAKAELDSVGGCTETAVTGFPAGVGEPFFDTVEGVIAHAMFAIGGVKGVEFGLGFGFAGGRGSSCNDAFRMENGRVVSATNRSGGVNGGVSNGMPILFRCAVRPTPSIAKEQETVDFNKGENVTLAVKGRHDPAIVRRVCPVIDSVTALVLSDLLIGRYGTDVLRNGGF